MNRAVDAADALKQVRAVRRRGGAVFLWSVILGIVFMVGRVVRCLVSTKCWRSSNCINHICTTSYMSSLLAGIRLCCIAVGPGGLNVVLCMF